MNNFTLQRLFIWSGVAAIVLFFLGFILAGFIPPPSPSLPADLVVAHYQEHATGIRAGMVLMMISGMFVPPLVAVISMQMRRMTGAHPLLVYAQLSAGTLGAVFFIIAPIIFIAAAFRPERSAEITVTLNDLAWIMAVIPWSPAFIQNIIIALGIFADKSPAPVLPKWLGYLNVWVAISFIPGGLLAFFKTGPFAWNGIFVFWLAGTVFIIWFAAMIYALFKAVDAEEALHH